MIIIRMRTADSRAETRTADGNGSGVAVMPREESYFVFPDPPERNPDEKMTNFDHLSISGNAYHLALHLGNTDSTLVAGDRYLSLTVTGDMTGLRYPDLLVAFDVFPGEYKRRRAYVIADQGKPPDFILEVASRSTGRIDTGAKRDDYESLGVVEYWRFDETGEYHGTRLAGDRLTEEGRYEPVEIEEVADGVLEGYSAALNLNLRWEDGQLKWHDPDTGDHIATFESEREARLKERERADHERERADLEREARLREQARAEALEAELRRLRGG